MAGFLFHISGIKIYRSMKIRYFFIILSLFILSLQAQAQKPQRTTVKGVLQDTLHAPIPFGTVMLLNPGDSSLVNFTSSNDKGEFAFANVKNTSYLLKVSHMSYLPAQKMILPAETSVPEVQTIEMKPIAQLLMEVVIKAAKAPLRIRGDTVEYDASTFKVPPGSTTEDLLRRLPGIDVDADGNISTQGKDVKRLYVDGKTFFGDDPKSITKNLGAEAIAKVQVYNEKSEQSKLTGVDDGSKEKAMNLELKEEFKKGAFGKVTAAAGTEERWAGRGNYNRFNDKTQLSFIGYANNINQTGVNWEDYGEFKGNNSFNDFDNGDFGFNRYGRGFYMFNGEDSPISNYDGKGLTQNFGGGVNYNYDHKGTKFNSSYFYNQTQLDYLQQNFQKTFVDAENSFAKYDTLTNSDFRSSHSLGTRFEREFDSSNRLILKANLRLSGNTNTTQNNQMFTDYSLQPYNSLNLDNSTDLTALKVTTAGIYRHMFKRKGRSASVSAGYNTAINDGSEDYFSLNKFFAATTPTEQIKQLVKNDKNLTELKASALYTEPLSKKFYLEFFYNFSRISNNSNRQATAPLAGGISIDSLSVYYEQITLYNRIGSVVRYSYNGFNASAGIAAQQLNLTGQYAQDKGQPWNNDQLTKSYLNYTPNLNMNYEFKNHMRLELGYTNDVSAPDFNDLQPIKNTSNPAYQVEGNPNLVPENSHRVDLGLNYWNPASFASIGTNFNFGVTRHPIVYSQLSTFVPGKGMITVSTPENLDQSREVSSWIWSNIPIVKTKLALDLNGGVYLNESPIRINDTLDQSRTLGFNGGTNLNITPGSKLVLSLGVNGGYNRIRYDRNESQNQNYYNYSTRASVKWQFITKMFFESTFSYSVYRNKSFGFDNSVPLWNASVRRILGKKSKFEVRVAAFDIFNKNIDIDQYAYRNVVGTSKTNTLARYFMLSLTYNMKGFENKIQKNRFM
jgi:hypothetical protein